MWRARSSRSISESSGVSGRFIISSAFSNASDRFFVSEESNTPLEGSALNSVIVTLSSCWRFDALKLASAPVLRRTAYGSDLKNYKRPEPRYLSRRDGGSTALNLLPSRQLGLA